MLDPDPEPVNPVPQQWLTARYSTGTLPYLVRKKELIIFLGFFLVLIELKASKNIVLYNTGPPVRSLVPVSAFFCVADKNRLFSHGCRPFLVYRALPLQQV
jgi:hypothetical protein